MALIPSILAAIGCGICGMMAAAHLHKRKALLFAWLHSLRRIEGTLKTQRLSMDKVLETGLSEHPLIDARLMSAVNTLRQTPSVTLAQAFTTALEAHPAPYEGAQEKATLHQIFQDLGTGTLEKRRDVLAQGLEKLSLLHEQATTTYEKNGRLYQNLGWLSGLALFLLLL